MSGRRLNGWQRIGIVLSVLWAIIAAFHEMEEINRRYDAAFSSAFSPVYQRCRDIQDRNNLPADGEACKEEAARATAGVQMESGWNIAIAALVPIPVFWLIAYALVGLVRWIRRGFKPSS
jgi:hypothetical protein